MPSDLKDHKLWAFTGQCVSLQVKQSLGPSFNFTYHLHSYYCVCAHACAVNTDAHELLHVCRSEDTDQSQFSPPLGSRA